MKTYTPNLDLAVLDRLRECAALFAPDFPPAKPARWAGGYLHGLLTDSERRRLGVPLHGARADRNPRRGLAGYRGRGRTGRWW
ncbi:unnamed protein product [Gemmata massiliana]|uniref:Uncharacterized protein n=1 Tax=Gemmata massiliana TaxID=1210884 RepID=A0A6P2D326_9BACT|nr:hypothetical protein [Gemmata massiliana]VTR95708.1 unnamed protein product [Gemmata massiliana]